jgi:hypothetical protein
MGMRAFPIHIHNKVYLAFNGGCGGNARDSNIYADFKFFSPSEAIVARDLLSYELKRERGDFTTAILSLSDIFRFDETMRKELSQISGLKLLVNIGSDIMTQARNTFLLGCHLIMSHGLGFEEAFLSLRPLHDLFDQFFQECAFSVEQSLRAFCCAQCLNWIDFRISASNDIQIDRFIHDVR